MRAGVDEQGPVGGCTGKETDKVYVELDRDQGDHVCLTVYADASAALGIVGRKGTANPADLMTK